MNVSKILKAYLKCMYSIVYWVPLLINWRHFLGMNEIVYNFKVLQPATLQSLNDAELLENASQIDDFYKKKIVFQRSFRHDIEK